MAGWDEIGSDLLDAIATALEAQAETVDYSFDMPAHRVAMK